MMTILHQMCNRPNLTSFTYQVHPYKILSRKKVPLIFIEYDINFIISLRLNIKSYFSSSEQKQGWAYLVSENLIIYKYLPN